MCFSSLCLLYQDNGASSWWRMKKETSVGTGDSEAKKSLENDQASLQD